MLNPSPAKHDALMDEVYRRQRHLYDFTRKYYLFGRDSLIRDLGLAPGERVLEIGCGTARNLIAIAGRYPGARLFGLDASSEMLKTAEQSLGGAGLTGQVRLAHGFAETVSLAAFGESQPFDRVLFSYSLSMIPDWEQALMAAHGVLAPSGKVHVVDFGDFASLPKPAAWLLLRWLALFHVTPRAQMLKGLEAMRPENLSKPGALRILPGRYAFVWQGAAESVRQPRFDVAEQSQGPGIPISKGVSAPL
jgi:S-adenosylmethionine-diacylgycerolhomoserine-N-methlytransferase